MMPTFDLTTDEGLVEAASRITKMLNAGELPTNDPTVMAELKRVYAALAQTTPTDIARVFERQRAGTGPRKRNRTDSTPKLSGAELDAALDEL